MTFGATLLATLTGALGGAVVGAFAAWLFSLDLRRRDRHDRAEEREEERLDRLAQRDQDRADRIVARDYEHRFRSDEREQGRRSSYEAEIARQWPRIADELMEYSNANRAVIEAAPAAADMFDRYRRSVRSLMRSLHIVAAIAEGTDHEIVNNLGVVVAVLPPYQRETVTAIDRIRVLLSTYMTTRPDLRERQKSVLRAKLIEVGGLDPAT